MAALVEPDPRARTAVILVNGYNGLGLHTALHVPRMFGTTFHNFIFIAVGAVDAGNFKGADEIEALRAHTDAQAGKYVAWARSRGYGSMALTSLSADVMGEVLTLALQAAERFPNHVFFAGQLLFTNETVLTRHLHNHSALVLQRRFYLANLPFVVLPVRVDNMPAQGGALPPTRWHATRDKSGRRFQSVAGMKIGILLSMMTQLDATGPFEVFARIPGAGLSSSWRSRSDRNVAQRTA